MRTLTLAPPTLFGDGRAEPTLDELLAGVWEGLAAHRPVECPVCGGWIAPEYGAHALPIGRALRSMRLDDLVARRRSYGRACAVPRGALRVHHRAAARDAAAILADAG